MPRKHETWYSRSDDSSEPDEQPGEPTVSKQERPEPEASFGPYKLIRLIGQGAQGTVHLAEDTRLHRRVALKLLHDSLLTQPQVLERFQREAAAEARPIRAKAISTVGRALRWSRREPTKAALIFALAVLIPAREFD